MTSTVFTCLLFLAVVAATPTPRSMIVHGQREAPPSRFTSFGAPVRGTQLNLRVALKAVNLPGLETILYNVSTPEHTQYGRYLSADEVGFCIILRLFSYFTLMVQ